MWTSTRWEGKMCFAISEKATKRFGEGAVRPGNRRSANNEKIHIRILIRGTC